MPEASQLAILPLTKVKLEKSMTKEFDCGDKFLNEFLKKSCAKKVQKNLIRGHVALNSGKVVGYITLQVHSLEKDWFVQMGSHPNQVPVLMIDQIATDSSHQGMGIGRYLLAEAFKSAAIISEEAGLAGIALWSHPRALGFYQKLGMVSIGQQTVGDFELTLMFLKIETVVAAMNDIKDAS